MHVYETVMEHLGALSCLCDTSAAMFFGKVAKKTTQISCLFSSDTCCIERCDVERRGRVGVLAMGCFAKRISQHQSHLSFFLSFFLSLFISLFLSLLLCFFLPLFVCFFLCFFLSLLLCLFVSSFVCLFVSFFASLFFVCLFVCFLLLNAALSQICIIRNS